MNELQSCEMNILREIVSVCHQLGIRYYMVCGSALGAVKYQGFIPWDDDVDIGMFREEYERFVREAPPLLPEHLFLQNFRSDKAFSQIYSKVRDSRTTYIEKSVANLDMHHGVYVDVFPLDGYPTTAKEQKAFERKKKYYKLICESRFDFPRSPKAALVTKLLRITGISRCSHKYLIKYDTLIASYPTADSPVICNHGNWQGKLEYAPREQYGEGLEVPFGDLTVRVPEKYDEYLTQKYGDWRADLPEEQKVGHHYYEVMDLEKPYTAYKKPNKT